MVATAVVVVATLIVGLTVGVMIVKTKNLKKNKMPLRVRIPPNKVHSTKTEYNRKKEKGVNYEEYVDCDYYGICGHYNCRVCDMR